MAEAPPVVLTIAGFDPSSGAGITADIKTIAAHGCYGVACLTALTVQTTAGVVRVDPVSPALISATLVELAADVKIAAIRIGMLGSGAVARTVADFLASARAENVVLDPVLKSTSGAELLDAQGLKVLRERLLPLATVVTPNMQEAATLAGVPVKNPDQMKVAAARLHDMGAPNVVVTGGELDKATEFLSFTNPRGKREEQWFRAERLRSTSTHGTGCAFATALACHLALGRAVPEGVLLAKAYVAAAIANAHPLGRGTGPVHHLYRMQQRPRRAAVHDPEPVAEGS
jgi:hydroxymethylpyrimidine/phosphomethylpyrimidine kinase